MTTDPGASQPVDDDLGGEILAALGRIEGRIEGLEVRLKRIEAAVIAAEHRRFYQRTLVGWDRSTDEAYRAAEAEWRRVEAAARRALEEEGAWRRVQQAGRRVLEEES
jgi:hypothetical protein